MGGRKRLWKVKGATVWAGVVLGLLAAGGCETPLYAQVVRSDTLIVDAVRFEAPGLFPKESLAVRVRTQANRRFLGIPGFTWWRWLYRVGEGGKLGTRISRGLKNSGEPPAWYDPALVEADVERLRLFYQQEGYRSVAVAARIDTLRNGERVRVTFAITPGAATYIRTVRYEGLGVLAPETQQQVVRSSLLQPAQINPVAPLHFQADNQRYSEPLLLEERRRLLALLRNQGYAAITRDSIRAIIFPQPTDSFDVTFQINPGLRYQFGGVHFFIEGPEPDVAPRADTLAAGEGGLLTWATTGESRLRAGLLQRSLRFAPGERYSQDKLLATKRRLEGTGVFSFSDIAPLRADTVHKAGIPYLPHRIELHTRERHQVRFETFMLQRSVVLAGADNELGTGLGMSYANTNLRGAGETFTIGTSGSIAADLDSTLFNAAQAEASVALTLPYLVWPFGGLDQALGLYQSRTRLSLTLLTARRDELGLIIRGRGGTRTRLELQHTPTLTSFVDLLDVSLSNPDTTANFEANFLGAFTGQDSLSIADRIRLAQLLEDYTQPQVNNALRYTVRAANVNPLRREQGYSYEAAAELGGNLPYLFDRWVFSPGTVEGSIPGLDFLGSRDAKNDLIYRQYLRIAMDLRRYRPLSPRNVLAWKVVGGWAHPLGRATVVPFDRRFYSGGASSVRGWRLRELGPGRASFGEAGDETTFLGGDIKLEAGVELRRTLLRNVVTADWIGAVFTDVGNVWFGPRNPGFGDDVAASGTFAFNSFFREVGVGSGVGLRIAWEYLIVRLDLAYRIHDPEMSGDWFPQAFGRPTPYFGIGHAF